MNCPLCLKPTRLLHREINEGNIRGYKDSYACDSCRTILTLEVARHEGLYETVGLPTAPDAKQQ